MTTRDIIASVCARHFVKASPELLEELELLVLTSQPEQFRRQLRLRCVEIVFTTGSQNHRQHLETEAERLYRFAVKEPEKKTLDKGCGCD